MAEVVGYQQWVRIRGIEVRYQFLIYLEKLLRGLGFRMKIIVLMMFFALAFTLASIIATYAYRKDSVSKSELFMLGTAVSRNFGAYVKEEYILMIRILQYVGVTLWLLAVIMIVVKSL